MKARLLSLTVAAGIGASVLVAVAVSPSSADTENCVTRAEYERTSGNMNPTEVEAVYDVYGTYAGDGPRGYWRQYRTCWAPGEREIIVKFDWDTNNAYDWFVRDA